MIRRLSDTLTAWLTSRSPRWPAVRRRWLKANPYCAACLGIKGLEVHHKLPVHIYPELELLETNLITLCRHRGCHWRIGHSFDWLRFNAHVEADAVLQAVRITERASY